MAKRIHVVKANIGMSYEGCAETKFEVLGLDDLTLESLKRSELFFS